MKDLGLSQNQNLEKVGVNSYKKGYKKFLKDYGITQAKTDLYLLEKF